MASDDAGLWRHKDGAAIYAHKLKQFTTTTMTAAEIHELGLREVSRIEGEMDAILRKLGRTTGTVKERMQKLQSDLSYPITDEGRTRIMADIDAMIRDADRRAAALFDLRPKAPVIAQPYPRFRWASAAASYTAPPLDGSRPGIFQMPLRPESMTKASLRTLVYHETIPGHHFHSGFGVENPQLPKFRQVRALGGISAIGEGWALYAERMVAQEGWYEGDLEGLLGQLDDELFRARRLVVDTGLHAMRWTRQQAIDYGIEASEVERYVVNPGQACSYKIGQLEIFRLRDKARTALGQRFSIKDFHNVVLAAGTVPLTVLEHEVDRRPGQSTASRYFTGAEQDRLDCQLTPETSERRRETVEQARRGLQELAHFDRSRMTDAERVSADVMQWQLQIIVDGEPFSDYDFPLDQFEGANVRIPNLLTVVHPVRTEADARNYVARLREVDDCMAEASEEAARLAANGIRPPRFILQSTISQMQQFAGSPAGENPLSRRSSSG